MTRRTNGSTWESSGSPGKNSKLPFTFLNSFLSRFNVVVHFEASGACLAGLPNCQLQEVCEYLEVACKVFNIRQGTPTLIAEGTRKPDGNKFRQNQNAFGDGFRAIQPIVEENCFANYRLQICLGNHTVHYCLFMVGFCCRRNLTLKRQTQP